MNIFQTNGGALDTQILLLLAPLLALIVGLQLWAILDLFRADQAVKGGNKVVWLLVILLVNPWGVLLYFVLGREERAGRDETGTNAEHGMRNTEASAALIRNPQSGVPSGPRNPYEAIRIEGLGKDFGPFRALDSLDLTVQGPGVFGFLGPNGAGKSTTIRMLTGLSRPTRGRAWIAGTPVSLETQAAAPLFGYLAEDPQFYGWMTGREFLRFTGQLFGLDGPALERRVGDLLALVGLAGAGNRRLGGYSRGMRQRLGIAHALIHDPPVLILDEPVSALDPIGRREVLELIARLGAERTVFMSTHILADVERVCREVAVLHQGRLVTTARTEELRERYAQPIFEIEWEQPAPAFAESLRAQPWVAGVEQHGTLIRVIAADVAAARAALLPLVAETGQPLLRYEQVLPTLEDVFVRLVSDAPAPAATATSRLEETRPVALAGKVK